MSGARQVGGDARLVVGGVLLVVAHVQLVGGVLLVVVHAQQGYDAQGFFLIPLGYDGRNSFSTQQVR